MENQQQNIVQSNENINNTNMNNNANNTNENDKKISSNSKDLSAIADILLSNVRFIIQNMGVERFIISLGFLIVFFSFFADWFYEATIITGNVIYSNFKLFEGNTAFFGYLIFIIFASLLTIFLMEYYNKKFDRLMIIHTDMRSTANLLSILLFVLIIGVILTHLSIMPVQDTTKVTTTNFSSGVGLKAGCYLGILGSFMILFGYLKMEFTSLKK